MKTNGFTSQEYNRIILIGIIMALCAFVILNITQPLPLDVKIEDLGF